jgi:ABC-type multidrug transport system permease subunit
VVPYYFGKVLAEVHIYVGLPMIISLILYFGIGLTVTTEKFFAFYFAIFCIIQCASSLGYLLSSMFARAETALQLTPTILMLFNNFGGFFASIDRIPVWARWF